MDLTRAMAMLAEADREQVRWERHLALGVLLAWMYWPTNQSDRESFEAFSVLSIIAQLNDQGTQRLQCSHYRDWLEQIFDPGVLLSQLAKHGIYNPSYNLFGPTEDERRLPGPSLYDLEMKCLIPLIGFLLRYKPSTADRRHRASLRRAKDFVRRYLSEPDEPVDINRIHRVWRRFTVTAPFHYVHHTRYRGFLALDPEAESVFPTLDKVLRERAKLACFFSQVRWVQERLQLDRRALAGQPFCTFPSTVRPRLLRLAPWSDEEHAIAAEYTIRSRDSDEEGGSEDVA